jgi:rod shape-determining protein MreD
LGLDKEEGVHWLRFSILVLSASILQTTLVEICAITSAQIKPNLLLILLAFFAIYCNPYDVIITSFIIGLCADLIGPAIGPQMISFGIIGTLVAELRQLVVLDKIPQQILAIGVAGFLTAALAALLYPIKEVSLAVHLDGYLLWQPLYSAFIGPFLFSGIAFIMGIRRPKPKPRLS